MPETHNLRTRFLASRSLAELAIIVVGILLAVAADDWWTNRHERIEENEILHAMAQDVIATQQLLDRALGRLEAAHTSLKVLSKGSAGTISKADDAQLAEALYSLFELPPLNVQMSSYNEIKDSGRLTLIENPKLRRLLAEYEAQHAFATQTHRDAFQHQQLKLDPYLIEHIQLSQFSEHALGINADAGAGTAHIRPLSDSRNHRLLLDDATFQNQVAFKYYLLAYYREQVRILRNSLDDVMVAINARISKIQ